MLELNNKITPTKIYVYRNDLIDTFFKRYVFDHLYAIQDKSRFKIIEAPGPLNK